MAAPQILWPGPGAPALLGAGERSFELLLLHAGTAHEPIRRFCASLSLRAAGGGRRVALVLRAVEPATEAFALGRAAAALELPELRGLSRTRVLLDAAECLDPAAPRRTQAYDLVAAEAVLRSRAVASRSAARGALRLAFASDLHLATLWTALHEGVARHAPDLAGRLLYPARHVARMVAELEAHAARGALDGLVLGGDLVDHAYRVPRADLLGSPAQSNVPLLIEALAPLSVPSFAIPGNHDYRLSPWRLRSYGLAEVGIPAARTRALLRAAGLFDAWPFRLSDLDALRSRERGGRTALAQHLLLLAPRTDFRATLGDLELVFASTGRDVLPRFRTLERGRRRQLLAAVPTSWIHPDLEGLLPEQLGAIEAAFEEAHAAGRGAALFLHAPLLHPPERGAVETHVARLDPADTGSHASDLDFERRLRRSGLRRGVLFRNPARLVRALLTARTPVSFFAGHVHRGHAMRLDRGSRTLRSTPLSRALSGRDHVPLVTAPSLGLTDALGEEAPGYLVATFASGALAGVERFAVHGGQAGPAGAGCDQ